MVNDTILQLRALFSGIPFNGLFFWQSVLLPLEVPYDQLIQEKFTEVLSAIPNKSKEQTAHYKNILELLKQLRREVLKDPQVRNDVEKIRDALVDNAANDLAIMKVRDNLVSHL